jgi:phosphoglycerate dehydrogenase-like enzyme
MAFQVGLTRDFLTPEGEDVYQDIGLDILKRAPNLEHRVLPVNAQPLTPDLLAGLDVVISLGPKYTRGSVKGVDRLLAVIRFGVGYEMIDVPALTDADIALFIAAGAVDHTMAESILAFMLAISHRVLQKDKLTREGRWNERSKYMGWELRDRILGIVGLGGIGRKLADMVKPFRMSKILAFDPNLTEAPSGVDLVSLDRLMVDADFVSVSCPLTEKTRGLIGHREIALMKPTAALINTARGGIVDEPALIEALRTGRIAGAGLDVFSEEPAGAGHLLATLDNVVLAPHAVGWTHEYFRDIGYMNCSQAVSLSHGEIPPGLVNREVLHRPGFLKKLKAAKASHAR